MPPSDATVFEATPRPVVSRGNTYPASFELPTHQHRRGQLLYASEGTVAVTTPFGAWIAPPERAVWIPSATPHAVRMIGAVNTRSVYIEPEVTGAAGEACRVIAVSPLLRALLVEAVHVPREYDTAGRDGLLMALLVEEIGRAPRVPLDLPLPSQPELAALCARFLEHPNVAEGIDAWAARLGMHRRSFTRLFRQETGMSFAQWRQQACLLAALPRLAAHEAVTEVALDLGYESATSFSTMFRRALGKPPSDYRAA
ncbi:AraC family transcriptional regulator [Luteibacter aegosomatissinici]|uniref:AraC family transcriptional regulator n=1 Tax=Luteibacter aegosomatissinici TaxID=2911539 RepID=UPI001FF9F821|nr:helix-turn-helix transcriptional regulator [Luteibacter aegosomatissinici]UPG94179.1 helix-turn-helix transcriptional regulator [Luteibacter aegosomatissinici]